MRNAASCLLALAVAASSARAEPSPCRVQPVVFEGWQAQQVANDWVQLTFVPQLGGRLIQVTFNGHPYLFVNPAYKGKYISPTEAGGRWINYGGDKIWPLPEGNEDEQPGRAPPPRLTMAPTPSLFYPRVRNVLFASRVRRIRPRACNIPGRSVSAAIHRRSSSTRSLKILRVTPSPGRCNRSRNMTFPMQTITQYNHNFWAVTPLNPRSSYLPGYHVRDGLATTHRSA